MNAGSRYFFDICLRMFYGGYGLFLFQKSADIPFVRTGSLPSAVLVSNKLSQECVVLAPFNVG